MALNQSNPWNKLLNSVENGRADFAAPSGPATATSGGKASAPAAGTPQGGGVRFLPNAGESGESAGSRAAKGTLAQLVAVVESVEIADQHQLYEFLEACRKISHTLAIYVHLAVGELEAAMKAAEKAKGKTGLVMGPGAYARIKNVTREIKSVGNSFGDAAKHSSASWRRFQKQFGPEMELNQMPARKKPSFQIV